MKPATTERKEILGLDILRFLCALAVVLSHYIPRVAEEYHAFHWGGAGVNIFFVISGFIIALSADGRSPFAFIQSRFTRLVPAAWICATLSLGTLLLWDVGQEGLIRRYLASLFFLPLVPWPTPTLDHAWIDGVYWTLFVEIAFYSVILVLLFFNAFRLIKPLATILGSVSLAYWTVFFAAYLLQGDTSSYAAIISTGFKRYFDLTLIHHGAWFGVGINIWLMTKGGIKNRWLSLAICFAGGALQASHHSIFVVEASPIPEVLFSAVGVALVYLSITRQPKTGGSARLYAACRWIGLTTYPLYLLHNQIGRVIVDHLTLAGLEKMPATLITIPLAVLLAFAVAYWFEANLQKALNPAFSRVAALVGKTPLGPALLTRARTFREDTSPLYAADPIGNARAFAGSANRGN